MTTKSSRARSNARRRSSGYGNRRYDRHGYGRAPHGRRSSGRRSRHPALWVLFWIALALLASANNLITITGK